MSETHSETVASSGASKSEAEVAFDLLNKLKGQGVWGERNITEILDMYAECLDATRGLRAYAGQSRIDKPIIRGAAVPAPQATAPTQTAPAPAAPNTVQTQQLAAQQYQQQALNKA